MVTFSFYRKWRKRSWRSLLARYENFPYIYIYSISPNPVSPLFWSVCTLDNFTRWLRVEYYKEGCKARAYWILLGVIRTAYVLIPFFMSLRKSTESLLCCHVSIDCCLSYSPPDRIMCWLWVSLQQLLSLSIRLSPSLSDRWLGSDNSLERLLNAYVHWTHHFKIHLK